MKFFQARLFLLFLLLFSTGCAPAATQPPASTIAVMAAASLTSAFQAIGNRFEQQHPGVKVAFNFAGSQQLAQQLAQGAPADVFASANLQQMKNAVDNGRIVSENYQIFAQNRLVIILPKDNPGRLADWMDLAKPGIKLVTAAKEVPAGQYSQDFLAKASQSSGAGADFQRAVEKNIVSHEDNVKAVLTKVLLGEADAGIVYTSDVSSSAREQITQIPIPDALNVIADYPIGVVTGSAQPELARAFVALVLSPEGQAILRANGFLTVTE